MCLFALSSLLSAVKGNVSVSRTVMCLYGQDCRTSVSNVIIYPAEGDSLSHLTQ